MSLDKEIRLHLVKVFGLVRTGVTEIIDQRVVTDGYTVDDLKGISLEKMNEYIGSTETFSRAWELTLAKVHSELHPPLGEIKTAENGGMVVEPMPEAEPILTPVETEPLSTEEDTKLNQIKNAHKAKARK